MSNNTSTEPHSENWKSLYKVAGIASIFMLVIMVIQIIIYILWPPPETAIDFFYLFQSNWLLGLLSLDLLYILNNTILIVIYLALYFSLRKINKAVMLIGLVLGLVGIAAYFASNMSFEMLSLSNQYATASSESYQTALLGAGAALLAVYKGTAFNVYYILNAITLLIFAIVMLRSDIFNKTTAIIGIISGVLMSIPSTAGAIGLVFSLGSLIPWAIFLVLISRKFNKLCH
ncbi:MAG: hypothetical protein CVU41_14050 [Chloroflexi bacterium HGW-Chloroflexi-3]|nr:MAG: hypothetical protein CVU41_14050 [Chloroflexi bacterium HGW-Chloroflexi-3]